MLSVRNIVRGFADILYVCCNPDARKILDKPDFVAKLAGEANLLEHPVLPAKASQLAGQPNADILTRGA